MKFVERRPFADPDIAAPKIVEIANDVDTVQDALAVLAAAPAPASQSAP
jgi:hypothetical protein